ncbi:MAG TPA: Do family serine endopeptidase [Bauldia sp.]|nr:Do family serine endopeptidase [Bauldia sp.]
MTVFVAKVALGAAMALSLFAVPAASAKNGGGPDSVADLVAPLLDAVVNISTAQTIAGSRDAAPPSDNEQTAPQGDAPFKDFFDEFFGDKNGGEMPDTRPRRVQSLGSGFVVDPSGIIVTNNHVIEDADEITANFSDGTKLTATVIGHDDKTDIAVIQVKPTKPLTAIKFGDSTKLRVGDWVMAIGNPFGLGGTVTVGIVSARNRDINAGPYDDFIQTDAAINRGNSGGPLFNENGEVIGINTAIISPTGGSIGLGFSIPSEIATNIVDQLEKFGETRRGWLGVRVQDVTDEVAKDLAMDAPKGALVAGVEETGPAAAAGIIAGDVILSMDGKTVDAMHALPRLVADEPVGKVVEVVILRKGVQQTLKVTLGRLEEASTAALGGDKAKPKQDDSKKDGGSDDQASRGDTMKPLPGETPTPPPVVTGPLGLSLTDLSPDARSTYGIKPDVTEGVVVTAVEPGSAAERVRLQAGDIISMVGDDPVTSPDEFQEKVDALSKDGRKNIKLVVQDKNGHVRWLNLPTAAD